MKQNTEQVILDLNQCVSSQDYHKLIFTLYENGYNFTNHWHNINHAKSTSEFYNSIRWSIDPELHGKAIKLADKVINSNRWMNSSVVELQGKDAFHYFKQSYMLKLKLFKYLRRGNMETFCRTKGRYVDVLHTLI